MLAQQVVSINMAIPYCADSFETIEEDKDNMTMKEKFSGLQELVFFIRSYVYKELHGFDDDFFAHQEEIDLCWRAINKDIL
jgi:GT2 family glycosyltransferase